MSRKSLNLLFQCGVLKGDHRKQITPRRGILEGWRAPVPVQLLFPIAKEHVPVKELRAVDRDFWPKHDEMRHREVRSKADQNGHELGYKDLNIKREYDDCRCCRAHAQKTLVSLQRLRYPHMRWDDDISLSRLPRHSPQL
jgi:hypothetical protein